MIRSCLGLDSPNAADYADQAAYLEGLDTWVAKAADQGWDAIEPRIADPDRFPAQAAADIFAKHNCKLASLNTVRLIRQKGLSLVHEDEAIRAQALKELNELAAIGDLFGSALSIGLFRGAAIEWKPIGYSKDMLVESLQSACDDAAQYDVTLILEPTNRYEINWLQTTQDGLEIVRRVDRPNLGMLLDMYHMYLEDDDICASIREAADVTRHFHLKEADGSPAGSPQAQASEIVLPWQNIFDTINATGFDGFVSSGYRLVWADDDCATSLAWLKKLI